MSTEIASRSGDEDCINLAILRGVKNLHIFVSILRFGDDQKRLALNDIMQRSRNSGIDFGSVADNFNSSAGSDADAFTPEMAKCFYEFVLEVRANPHFAAFVYLLLRPYFPDMVDAGSLPARDGNVSERDIKFDAFVTESLGGVIAQIEATTGSSSGSTRRLTGGVGWNNTKFGISIASICNVLYMLFRIYLYCQSGMRKYQVIQDNPSFKMIPDYQTIVATMNSSIKCAQSSEISRPNFAKSYADITDDRLILFLNVLERLGGKGSVGDFARTIKGGIDIYKCVIGDVYSDKVIFNAYLSGDANFDDVQTIRRQSSPGVNSRSLVAVSTDVVPVSGNSGIVNYYEASESSVEFIRNFPKRIAAYNISEYSTSGDPTLQKILRAFENEGVKVDIHKSIIDYLVENTNVGSILSESGIRRIIVAAVNARLASGGGESEVAKDAPPPPAEYSAIVGDVSRIAYYAAMMTFTSYSPTVDLVTKLTAEYEEFSYKVIDAQNNIKRQSTRTIRDVEQIYRESTGFILESMSLFSYMLWFMGIGGSIFFANKAVKHRDDKIEHLESEKEERQSSPRPDSSREGVGGGRSRRKRTRRGRRTVKRSRRRSRRARGRGRRRYTRK